VTRRLILLLGETQTERIRWAAANGGEVLQSGGLEGADALKELTSLARDGGEIVALLPGQQVSCRRLPTAPRNAAKLRQAARYLMEDELAEAAERLEIGAAAAPSRTIAFAARADIVRGWRETFSEAGLDIDILSTDYLCLSSGAQEASIVADGGRILVAFAGIGLAVEAELFEKLAPGLFAEAPSVIAFIGEERLSKSFPGASAVDWLGPSDDRAVLGALARALASASPPNFLQKRLFRGKALSAAFGPWRRSAALAAGLGGAFLVSMAADGARLARAEARWTESARDLHRAHFPEAASEDPAEFARKRLAAGGDEAQFLLISARIAQTTQASDGVDIDRIRFDAGRGDYVVSLRSESDGAIEAFKTGLAAAGIAATDSGGFRRNGEFWTGDLKVRLQ
jgi:type II secretion system protein L